MRVLITLNKCRFEIRFVFEYPGKRPMICKNSNVKIVSCFNLENCSIVSWLVIIMSLTYDILTCLS